jgi:hypothetical protein
MYEEHVMATPAALTDSFVTTALFRDFERAERAFLAANEAGYEASKINVLMSEETRQRFLETKGSGTPLGQKATEPAPEASKSAEALGGPAGGTMGTVAPVIGAVGAALLIPGLGLAVAGPIAIALTAAGTVGVATGLIGALTNWGIPKEQAQQYESAVRNGGIVIGVTARSADDARELANRWREAGGEMIDAKS